MSFAALIIMLLSWCVITYFTVKFFIKVLKTPQRED